MGIQPTLLLLNSSTTLKLIMMKMLNCFITLFHKPTKAIKANIAKEEELPRQSSNSKQLLQRRYITR